MRKELLQEIESLSVEERRELVEKIQDSLPEDELELTDAQLEEIERRIAEHEAHPETAIPLAKFQTELKRQLRK